MVKIDVDEFLKPDESYYSFVIGVAKRAREITEEQLKKMKDFSEQEKTKNTVIDRAKQLPEELSTKPVRLAIEDIKTGNCHLEIESAEKVLEKEEEERIQKLLEHQMALEGKLDLVEQTEAQDETSESPGQEEKVEAAPVQLDQEAVPESTGFHQEIPSLVAAEPAVHTADAPVF